jgi:hypothetical protein
VAPNARDAETGRRLGLPDSPVSLSDPSYPWILKDLGWLRRSAGLRPTMARKTDKKLMTSVSLFLAKPQVTGFGIARSNDSGHQLSVSRRAWAFLTLVGHLSQDERSGAAVMYAAAVVARSEPSPQLSRSATRLLAANSWPFIGPKQP